MWRKYIPSECFAIPYMKVILSVAVAAPIYMCFSAFSDSSGLTLKDMQHLGNFTWLRILHIQQLPDRLISGKENPWGWLPRLSFLVITGELPRHTHAVHISAALTELPVITPHGSGNRVTSA